MLYKAGGILFKWPKNKIQANHCRHSILIILKKNHAEWVWKLNQLHNTVLSMLFDFKSSPDASIYGLAISFTISPVQQYRRHFKSYAFFAFSDKFAWRSLKLKGRRKWKAFTSSSFYFHFALGTSRLNLGELWPVNSWTSVLRIKRK